MVLKYFQFSVISLWSVLIKSTIVHDKDVERETGRIIIIQLEICQEIYPDPQLNEVGTAKCATITHHIISPTLSEKVFQGNKSRSLIYFDQTCSSEVFTLSKK